MKTWYEELLPSRLIALMYIVLSLIILTIGMWPTIGPKLLSSDDRVFISDTFDDISDRFQTYTQLVDTIEGVSQIVSFIFWAAIGSMVYMALWFLLSLISDLKNEISLSLVYVHPRSFRESKHWVSVLSRYVLRAAAIILLGAACVVYVYIVIPGAIVGIYANVESGVIPIIRSSAIAVAGLFGGLHIIALLLRIALLPKFHNE